MSAERQDGETPEAIISAGDGGTDYLTPDMLEHGVRADADGYMTLAEPGEGSEKLTENADGYLTLEEGDGPSTAG